MVRYQEPAFYDVVEFIKEQAENHMTIIYPSDKRNLL